VSPRPLALALAAWAVLASSAAEGRDPQAGWRTLSSPSLSIHFHAGERELAARVAREGEAALERLEALYGYRPAAPIEVTLGDESDAANGLASVLPYNRLELLAALPSDDSQLADYDDALRLLVIHELAHLVIMDHIRGLPAWLNRVLGRTVFPNGAQPSWFLEGLSVYAESRLGSAGRLRSSLFRMYLRVAALAGTIPPLDRLTNTSRDWPQGSAPYLYGAFFIDFLARRHGEEALAELAERMAGLLFPWALNALAREVLGQDYPTLYAWFREEAEAEARALEARLEADGLTAPVALTARGQFQLRPRLSPGGGVILYYSSDRDRPPTLRLLGPDGQDDRALLEVNGDGGACFSPDGREVIFSQPEVVDTFHLVQDLYSLELVTGRVRRLSTGLRARAPDVSPDGRRIVFVRAGLGQAWLSVLDRELGEVRELTPPDPARPADSPRWSPDGRHVVFTQGLPGGGRGLRLLDLEAGTSRALTGGGFMDLEPVFSPDGRAVVFTSDRTGLYNLYRVELEDGALTRLTNVLGGVFSPQPLPDGRGALVSSYGPAGYDLARVEWPADRLRAGGFPPDERRPPRPAPPAPAPEVESRERAYQPWGSLLPRAWLPTLSSDSWGPALGLTFGGQDALGVLRYLVGLSLGLESLELQADANLTAQLAYPLLGVYLGRHSYRTSGLARVDGRPFPVEREELALSAELSLPFARVLRYDSLYLSYDLRVFRRRTEVPLGPADLSPVLPDDRPRAYLSLGWYGTDTRTSLMAISPEQGLSSSVSMRYSHPALGAGGQVAELRAALRAYLPLDRERHHVLALGLQGGVAVGDETRRSAFWVGGLPLRDPLQDSLFGYRYGGLFLRGYPEWAFSGSAYLLGSVEYRLPLARFETGFSTLPFFLDRLHLAFFVDVGGASPDPDLDRFVDDFLNVGLGLELRLELLLGYYLPSLVRLGIGRGLMAQGVDNFYLTVGSGF